MNLPAIGDVLQDRYRLEAALGEGGFGTVVRATDLQTGAQVAVKLLHPDDGDSYLTATRRRFEREVAVLMQLKSPHTVRLLGFGTTTSGLLYMVFEYLPGRDLSEVLKDGVFPPQLAEHILRQVLASLAEAHRAGLSHRDIKPANIRVVPTRDDPYHAKLIDFGIARSIERDRVAVTKTGELIGTPRYMSPEQLRERELTPASDIYSLGVVLVEMLAGPGALLDNTLGAQLGRLHDDFRFDLPSTGDPRLDSVVHTMTSTQPEVRFRTVGQVLDALDGRSAVAIEEVSVERPLGLIAAAVVLLTLCVAVFAYLVFHEEQAAPLPSVDRTALQRLNETPAPPPPPEPPPPSVDAGGLRPDLPALPARACNKLPFRGHGWLRDGRSTRSAAYLPTRLDAYEAVPLLVFLHGKEQDPPADEMPAYLEVSGLAAIAEREGVLITAPRDFYVTGLQEPWEDPEDVSGLREHVEWIIENACIDESSVFVIGQGDSAFLNQRLRCESWVTATGFNSTRKYHQNLDGCAGPALPSVWIGPRDTPRLPRDGQRRCNQAFRKGGTTMSLDGLRASLVDFHECREPADWGEQAPGTCLDLDCRVPLRYCEHDGGEPWPNTSAEDPCGGVAPDFPVGERMWEFFETVEPLKPK